MKKNTDDCAFLLRTPIAHRGLWDEKLPENSLPAFEKAVSHGFAIEIDIHLTKDNKIVVFHDHTLSRMTDCEGIVEDMTLSRLMQCKLGGTDSTIPSLAQVLQLVDGKVPLLIELKSHQKNAKRFAEIATAQLKDYSGEFAVQSFDPILILNFKKLAPHIIRGQLATQDYENMSKLKSYLLSSLFFNRFTKVHFISYNVNNLPNKYVDSMRFRNNCRAVLAWTVTSESAQGASLKHADNIIFDRYLPKT